MKHGKKLLKISTKHNKKAVLQEVTPLMKHKTNSLTMAAVTTMFKMEILKK